MTRSSDQLSVLFRQLTLLYLSGSNLARCLEILADQVDDETLRGVLRNLFSQVCSGWTLSAAMQGFPRIFSSIQVYLVRSGEVTGRLGESLTQLSLMLERESRLQKKLQAALTYPCFILATTLLLTVLLFRTVLPNFIEIFRSMHCPLPLLTQVLMTLTDLSALPGFWVASGGGAWLSWRGLQHLWAQPAGRLQLYRFWLRLPLVSPILRFSSLSRYCWTLNTMLGAGLPMTTSLPLAAGASGSPVLMEDVRTLEAAFTSGLPLSAYYESRADLYSRLLATMVNVAEETSSLDSTFGRLGEWFDQETESRLDLIYVTLEPLLMAFVAVLVGSVVIAIFLPLYSYLGKLGS